MNTLLQDLRYAMRMLTRNPGFTAIAVVALALGIGANSAVFTVLNGVLLRPLGFAQESRLVLVSYRPDSGPFGSAPSLVDSDYVKFREQTKLYDHLAAMGVEDLTLTGMGDPARLHVSKVTLDYFQTLGVNPAQGRLFEAQEDQKGRDHVVLLGDALWRTRFQADPRIVGRKITLDGEAYDVVGVMPSTFTFPAKADLWKPMGIVLNPHLSWSLPVVGRLKPGVTRQQALAELNTFAAGLKPSDGNVHMLAEILPLKEFLVGDIRSSLQVFAWAVACVLLIACANVANLLLMRASSRRQEIAVRTALGAGRWRVVRQLLTESTLVSMLGGAAGLLVAIWSVPLLLALAPEGEIPRLAEIHVDGWVLLYTFGVSLATGLLFGLAPALQATRREFAPSLNARTYTARGGILRNSLVVAEISLALMLLTGAGLMTKSFIKMRTADPGFRANNLITMAVDLPQTAYQDGAKMRGFYDRTLEKLSAVPGVRSVGLVNFCPLGKDLMKGSFTLPEGRKRPPGYFVDKPTVGPGYFQAMGIRLIAGREFTAQDTMSAPHVVIVSESVASGLWPNESAVGKLVSMEDHPKANEWLTIVGVVADVRQTDLRSKRDVAIYEPYMQVNGVYSLGHMTFALRTDQNPASLAPAMRAVIRDVDRDLPVQELATMEEVVALSVAEPLFQTRLLAAFSILALMLSAIGIYGVLAYSVAERTREIGIRMALGAKAHDVLRMVLRRVMTLAAIGLACGAAGALGASKVLAKLVFGGLPSNRETFMAVALLVTDHWTMAVVALLLAAVAFSAGWIPARRATRVDPLVALRYE